MFPLFHSYNFHDGAQDPENLLNHFKILPHYFPGKFIYVKFILYCSPFHISGNSLLTSPTSQFVYMLTALTPELKTTLDKVVTSHKVVLFMKGTKDFPQCGFSNTVVQILNSLNVPFETFNILENEMLRQGLKEYSSWPTFPQLYIEGEFFGGCDITVG